MAADEGWTNEREIRKKDMIKKRRTIRRKAALGDRLVLGYAIHGLPERKSFSWTIQEDPANPVPVQLSGKNVYLLNAIPRGSEYWKRIGNEITIDAIEIRTTIYYHPDAALVGGTYTMSIVWDQQPVTAATTYDDIYRCAGAHLTITAFSGDWGNNTTMLYRNWRNKKRFRILSEDLSFFPKIVQEGIGPSTRGQLGFQKYFRPRDKKGKKYKTVYKHDPEDPLDWSALGTGAILLVVAGEAVGTAGAYYSVNIRIYYYDI